ncbi:hypothetical protein TNCV_2183961 [Trichonephila clavipes]|nr:hypothetical protein TNCV_2183961 [Trichonephila clavipes]
MPSRDLDLSKARTQLAPALRHRSKYAIKEIKVIVSFLTSDIQTESCVRDLIPIKIYRTDDEAPFWLNGYVNKQNCRIWSEANPQVYVETPLYPEKLTVWCALWAGGILLQKR